MYLSIPEFSSFFSCSGRIAPLFIDCELLSYYLETLDFHTRILVRKLLITDAMSVAEFLSGNSAPQEFILSISIFFPGNTAPVRIRARKLRCQVQ